MVSDDARAEMEEHLGRVPSFIAELSDPAADNAWALLRDFELAETDLPAREKALVGLGAAAAMQCPYCVHFHKAEAKIDGVSEAERKEAIDIAAGVRYFSTVLHGAEVEMSEFAAETANIMSHVEGQQAAPSDD